MGSVSWMFANWIKQKKITNFLFVKKKLLIKYSLLRGMYIKIIIYTLYIDTSILYSTLYIDTSTYIICYTYITLYTDMSILDTI